MAEQIEWIETAVRLGHATEIQARIYALQHPGLTEKDYPALVQACKPKKKSTTKAVRKKREKGRPVRFGDLGLQSKAQATRELEDRCTYVRDENMRFVLNPKRLVWVC